MIDTYHRARYSILSDILSYPTIKGKYWEEDRKPIPGSLVTFSCAPDTEWYLSWVKETELHEHGWHKYLLESIETQKLCWWENVGIFKYDSQRVAESPWWKWSDKQYAFRDKWHRVLAKNDAYLIRGGIFEFCEDNSVHIGLRRMWSNEIIHREIFDNWKKVTAKMLNQFYLDGVEKQKAGPKKWPL